MEGDLKRIKGMVCPLSDWSLDDIERMLHQLETVKRNNGQGWVTRYNVNGVACIWASGFFGHQKLTHREAEGRYGQSNIPPPPQRLLSKAGIKLVIDNSFIEELRPKYPHLDLDAEWEKCQLWWSESNREMKRPKSAFINWLNKARGSKQPEVKSSGDQQGMREL